MIEGSGSIPLTRGSGRPKNTWIRIRIRNTALQMTRSIFSPTWITSWVLMIVSYPALTTLTYSEGGNTGSGSGKK